MNVAPRFAPCGDAEAAEAIWPLLRGAVELVSGRCRGVEAVILTGSFARGEGTVLRQGRGFRVLGDVEFLVILRSSDEWPAVRRRMVELGQRATAELGHGGLTATIEYTPADIHYLRRRIRPCMFACDLREHGKVLWGRDDILEEIPPFGRESIPPEDAVELVMNRILELLTVEKRSADADRETYGYQLVKTVLDIAGSALCFNGRHLPSYGERPRAFRQLTHAMPELRDALPAIDELQAELESAARCKARPTLDLLVRRDGAELQALVLGWAKALWLWEMRRLLGRPSAAFPDIVSAYLWREPIRTRLRGWVKYWWHPLRPSGMLSPWRASRLLFRASPRRLAYAAALLAHEAAAQHRPQWTVWAAALLPVSVAPDGEAVLGKAEEIWRWLIRNN